MDLTLALLGEDKASSAFDSVAGAARSALRVVLDFSKESVKAFLDSEAAEKRLALAAKELTDVFKQQASQFQQTLGVADDTTMAIQTMLLQFGEAPGQIQGTTKAILDFAAATGQDATSAASQLISSVETGRNAFKEYGIQLGETGHASADMAIATKALADKFGGAADAQAETLTGQLAKASEAFEDVKKSFGGMIAEFVQKSGVINSVTQALKSLSDSRGDPKKHPLGWSHEQEADRIRQALANPGAGGVGEDRLRQRLAELEGLIANPVELSFGDAKFDRETTQGRKAREEREKQAQAARKAAADKRAAGEARWNEFNLTEELAFAQSTVFDEGENARGMAEAAKRATAEAEREAKRMQAILDKQLAVARKKEKEAQEVGEAIGMALGAGLTNALSALMDGGQKDVGAVIIDVLAGAIAAAGTIIGGLLGGPAGAALGGSVGGLFSKGLTTLAGGGRRHDGGWMGVPRMHAGQWVGGDEYPAILQGGERVLSRAEVRRMGGGGAVDAAASGRGGGGGTVVLNVSTIDAKTTRDFFQADGGRGLFNAVRTGRGDMARLLKRGR